MLPKCHNINSRLVLGDILGQETPNLRDPYLNSTTVLFDKKQTIKEK